jgi:hypothetical protein
MLKSMSVGFACLALVTLGVASGQGQDGLTKDVQTAENADEKVIVVDIETTPAKPDLEKLAADIDILVSEQAIEEGVVGTAVVEVGDEKPLQLKVIRKEGGEIVISDDLKADAKARAEAEVIRAKKLALPALAAGSGIALDKESRDALEKLKASLQVDIERLVKEGNGDAAVQKKLALAVLDRLLSNQIRATAKRQIAILSDKVRDEAIENEMQELKKRLADLSERLKTLPNQEGADGQKLRAELEAGKARMAEAKQRIDATIRARTAKVRPIPATGAIAVPGMPGMPSMPGAHQIGIRHVLGAPARSHALKVQAEALAQAAHRLKEANLPDQARNLTEQAERARNEAAAAEKMEADQAQVNARVMNDMHDAVVLAVPGQHGAELHRSIKELQEQVQLLRKEVGELRELLQKKQ